MYCHINVKWLEATYYIYPWLGLAVVRPLSFSKLIAGPHVYSACAFAIFMVGLLHAAQGEEATAREQPFQQPNVKRTFYQRSVLPSPAQPAHAAAIAATGRRRPCEACRPKAASLTVHIGPAHLLASGCWPKLIGNWRPFHLHQRIILLLEHFHALYLFAKSFVMRIKKSQT